jgi:Holliday junction resolvase RusA-like endonuclease
MGELISLDMKLLASFTVYGTPVPQGSKRAFVNPHTGKAIIADANKKTKPWRQEVAGAAAMHSPEQLCEGPVRLRLRFAMPRPKSVKPKKRPLPSVKPDLSKLCRAIEDALTGVLYRDDSQVTSIDAAKIYADSETPPGVFVEVFEQ